MKSKIKIIILSSLMALFIVQTAQAALINCGRSGTDPCKIGDLTDSAIMVVNFLVGSATLVAMAFVVYGGVRMMLSRGNEDQVKSAKSTMTNAIIGLLIVVMSYLIVGSAISYFTGYSFDQLRLFFHF